MHPGQSMNHQQTFIENEDLILRKGDTVERKLFITLFVALMLLFVCTSGIAEDKLSENAEKILSTGPIEGQTKASGYKPKGGIDPFSNLWLEKPEDSQSFSEPVVDCPKGAVLQELGLGQLNLIGIILTGSGNRALLQEASGRGHIIAEGMCIGKTGSKVATILFDKIIFEEKMRDIVSREISIRKKEKVIHKP